MNALAADLALLRANWRTVHGGWSAALRNAQALVARRRVLVKTTLPTPQGEQLVLCTRLRLSGDTQTDIRRRWFETAPPAQLTAAADAHFAAVAAATQGWNVALALERLAMQFIWTLGAAFAAIATIVKIVHLPPSQMFSAALTNPLLWSGLGLPLLGHAVRWALRWRLRRLFRRA